MIFTKQKHVKSWQYRLFKYKFILKSPIQRFFDVLRSKHYDIVYLQKDVLFHPISNLLFLLNSNIIFDLDDPIFEVHPTLNFSKYSIENFFIKLRRKNLNYILKKSKSVIVCSDYLSNYVKKYNKNVHIMTGPINVTHYIHQSSSTNNFTVGWIGSPMTSKYLINILPALKEVKKIIPNLVIKVVGGTTFPYENLNIVWEKYSLSSEIDILNSFDVGIMPLNNDRWSEGKCGFKILQYFAMNLPVVASPIGINKKLVEHGKNGFLAHNLDDWVKYLVILAKNKELRLSMGNEGRKLVVKKYDLSKLIDVFAEILKNTID